MRQMIGVRPPPPLNDGHRVAVRMRVIVQPALLFLEASRFDDEHIFFPAANRRAEKRRLRRRGQRPPVYGDRSKCPHQLVQERDPVRALHDLERHAADAGARDAREQAQAFGVDRLRPVAFVGGGACRSEDRLEAARNVLVHVPQQRAAPESRQVGPAVARPRRGT